MHSLLLEQSDRSYVQAKSLQIEAFEDIGDVTLGNTKARGDPRRPSRVVVDNLLRVRIA